METEIKKSKTRKEVNCCWCGELILKGEINVNWSSDFNGYWEYIQLHQECSDAIDREDFGSDDYWSFYSNHRGKTYNEFELMEGGGK